jgi:transposase
LPELLSRADIQALGWLRGSVRGTQIQALDRTQPLLPIDFGKAEQRTHEDKRHGVTNLFAALNVGTGQVLGSCRPSRNGAAFLACLKKATAPHRGREIHVVLDNLSTHTTPEVMAWLERNPHVTFHIAPVGSSWLNMVETWFGLITKQSIRRGTFTSVSALINQIRAYTQNWNTRAEPFEWTATTDEALARVRLVQTNIKKLVDNNAK